MVVDVTFTYTFFRQPSPEALGTGQYTSEVDPQDQFRPTVCEILDDLALKFFTTYKEKASAQFTFSTSGVILKTQHERFQSIFSKGVKGYEEKMRKETHFRPLTVQLKLDIQDTFY